MSSVPPWYALLVAVFAGSFVLAGHYDAKSAPGQRRSAANGRSRIGTYASAGSYVANVRLFVITETLETAIAAPASAGLSTPSEATGTSVAL